MILYDIAAMALAGLLALLTRFEFRFYSIEIKYLDSMWKFMPLNILLTLFIFYLFRMYQSLWAYAGITEVQNILSDICPLFYHTFQHLTILFLI